MKNENVHVKMEDFKKCLINLKKNQLYFNAMIRAVATLLIPTGKSSPNNAFVIGPIPRPQERAIDKTLIGNKISLISLNFSDPYSWKNYMYYYYAFEIICIYSPVVVVFSHENGQFSADFLVKIKCQGSSQFKGSKIEQFLKILFVDQF